MIVEFEGERYELDTDHVGFKDAMGIQSHTGMSIADWQDALDWKRGADGKIVNPPPEWLPAVGGLYWLMRQQCGNPIEFADMNFDFTAFTSAYFRAMVAELKAAEAVKAAAPDPTVPSPPSPSGDPPSPAPPSPRVTTPRRRPAVRGEAVAAPTG